MSFTRQERSSISKIEQAGWTLSAGVSIDESKPRYEVSATMGSGFNTKTITGTGPDREAAYIALASKVKVKQVVATAC